MTNTNQTIEPGTRLKTGTRVKIIEGWVYSTFDPLASIESDGKTYATVDRKQHDHFNTTYILLDDGRLASAATTGLEVIQ